MPPRIRLRPRALRARPSHHPSRALPQTYAYASLASPATSAYPIDNAAILRFPPTQPPSHKPAETRKSQLHRQYQSLLRSSPLILLFQHNNLKAVEFMSIRRELALALSKVDAERVQQGQSAIGEDIKLQVIQTGIFVSALRVVELFHPNDDSSSGPYPLNLGGDEFTHGLSKRAYEVASNRKLKIELEPLLSGPMAVVAFPSVSPQHLKTVLSILSPSTDFPAPKRKANPEYHEPAVQAGLQKLMLLGARVEGKVMDDAGTRWVGGIAGGIDGLRAQLVAALQGVGAGLANTLEGASKSLYFTLEGRRIDLEEKEKDDK